MLNFLKWYAQLFMKENSERIPERYIFPVESPGLYIHFPFCKNNCSYCPYLKMKYDEQLVSDYIIWLQRERMLHGTSRFSSLYIGGGSPSNDIRAVRQILQFLASEINGEIAMEVHPDDAQMSNLQRLKELGVNYVSLGIQTLDPELQNKIGRGISKNINIKALENVMHTDFDVVNVDLILDPQKDFNLLQKDFIDVVKFNPQQVSIYPLMPFTFTGVNTSNMPDVEISYFEKLDEIAEEAGYTRDMLWTYTNKQNLRYSSVGREFYLGMGLSASTFTGNYFTTNTFSLGSYIKSIQRKKLPIASLRTFNQFQGALFFVFWKLYINELYLEPLIKYFPEAEQKIRMFLWFLEKTKLVKERDNYYFLTKKGRRELHKMEEWITHNIIDPLWSKLRKTKKRK
ncbi:MAG: radical SAM protein [Kosmotogaceae bacterium]